MNILRPDGQQALTIEDAKAKLEQATRDYAAARFRYEECSREESRAMTALNDAQKAFDRSVADIKSAAPARSDWCKAGAS
jgi:hypothetical protein